MESVVAVWRNPVVAAAAPVVVAERPARNAGVIVAQIGLAVRPRREDAEIALAPACQPAEQIIIILGVAPARIFAGARNREHVLEVERPPRAQIDRPRNARDGVVQRSEERRVGKEWVRQGRYWGATNH